MKRFYKSASVSDANAILLDGRAVKTPGGNPLALPTRALGEAIAQEWVGQGDQVVPATMPLTRIANTAIDSIAAAREAVIDQIAAYGGTDLLSYRAEGPDVLVIRQAKAWDPLLDWAHETHGARLAVTAGVMHVAQNEAVLAALRAAVAGHSEFGLVPLHAITSLTGSLVLALAVAAGRLDAAQAFALSRIDEEFQAEKWGTDAEAEARARAHAEELETAAKFLRLLAA
ncbi:MAG: ATPase [Alphaproteobacteria bacterium]|nr:ATPase [Alphaproteobacteria bacterium]